MNLSINFKEEYITQIILNLQNNILKFITEEEQFKTLEKIISFISRIVSISDKNKCQEKEFLFNFENIMTEKKAFDLIIKTYINILENNSILSEYIINYIFDYFINKMKIIQIKELLLTREDLLTKFENRLNNYVIDIKDIFLEEKSFNLLLLEELNNQKYFQYYNNSIYTKKTKRVLEYISSYILNIEGSKISYNQIKNLYQNKERVNIFSIIDEYNNDFIKNKRIKKLEDYMNIFEDMIKKMREIKDYFSISYFSPEKVLSEIRELIKEIKYKEIYYFDFDEVQNKIKKFESIYELSKQLEEKINKNYFFTKVHEINITKEEKFILFEQLLNISNNNIDEINSKIISIFLSFIKLKKDEKEIIIENFSECNNLYQSLYFDAPFMDIIDK